ncbi:histidine kinase dimerization/phosphoacceptor domain -containing protein [Mucilaginibacter sp. X4EP1]|uniref:tetratricopeptide repeat-containing sensor histidine kinase n=1 Tax=Mucilaginibacter sp. X4EP1 TaxID=2723092 RepID=UPI002167C1A2|nr:histidine kinase dimerization/phosphoacceptor domain -containing protein [Mucilaginibacter sp. X4EP1]MCS3813427.1 two-component sensor histidine kinase [Mucilaginibacter sp. X4EP1]
MFKKALLFVLVFLSISFYANAQKDTVARAGRMKPSFQKLLLELSTTYFTVVKENQVDLDSSLIHVSRILSLSRLPVVSEGIDDKEILNGAGWVDERAPWIGEKQLKLAVGQKYATLAILMGAYFVFEPGNDSIAGIKSINYLTAGIKECEKWNNIRLKLAAQRLLAKLYLKTEKFAEADKLFEAVKDGFIKAGDQPAAATTCSWWGLYAPVTATSTVPRIQHTEIAYRMFKSVNDKEGQINSLINDCYLHLLGNDLAIAEKLAKEAVNLTEIIRFPYSHYVTGALTTTAQFQGKFGEPLTYAIKSIENSEMTKDSIPLPNFYGIVAGLYNNEGNREDIAIYWQKKSVDVLLSQREHDTMGIHDLVEMLLERGRGTEALTYIKKLTYQVPPVTTLDSLFYNLTLGLYDIYTKNWKSAHSFFNKADLLEKKVEQHGLNVRKPEVLISLATLDFKEGNYKQARVYYEEVLSLQTIGNGGLYGDNAVALEALIKIDSVAGDQKAQLRDYRRFTAAIIRNYKVSKTMLAEELQVKYATSERINQINLLNQKAKLEQANLQQANLTKNITIAGIILVIIIAGLLYRQSQIRKKNNDIITRKNELMQKLLDEKEWLIKEIHHRVKNNLHTVICLLESQAMYLENDALKAVENSRHRIYAMSLIHQKLYQSDDIKVVNMNTYLTDFVTYLEESFGAPENILIKLDADEIKLSAGQAIPLGLIVNEAITNAFKYAFPHQKNGEIRVTLKKEADNIYLSVADNGIGFKQAEKEVNSLGLELIKGLALDLRGELILDTVNGTYIRISFHVDPVGIPADELGSLTLKV